ncbi:MAG: sirohydrochlorin cobaltochelatase [Bacilli bacterium]
MSDKAILVVSFGSTYKTTREKTIDLIEKKIKEEFVDYAVYGAYTSKVIIDILKKRDQLEIMTVNEALEKLLNDGIRDVIVLPTLMLNGIEFDKIQKEVNKFKHLFNKLVLKQALLSSTDDCKNVTTSIIENNKVDNDEAVVFMGHGSYHHTNSTYALIDYMLKEQKYDNYYMATVEAYPNITNIIETLKFKKYKKIVLVPFMIVCGDHAINDMASSSNESWKSILEKSGFLVECVMKGLGESDEIRQIFIDRIKND